MVVLATPGEGCVVCDQHRCSGAITPFLIRKGRESCRGLSVTPSIPPSLVGVLKNALLVCVRSVPCPSSRSGSDIRTFDDGSRRMRPQGDPFSVFIFYRSVPPCSLSVRPPPLPPHPQRPMSPSAAQRGLRQPVFVHDVGPPVPPGPPTPVGRARARRRRGLRFGGGCRWTELPQVR